MRRTLVCLALACLASPAAAQRTDTRLEVGATGTLRIDSQRGTIRIRGGAGRELHVLATHDARTRVDVRRAESGARIEVEQRSGAGVDFEIVVPRGWAVNVDGLQTSVTIEDTEGDVDVENVGGSIVVRGVRTARLETVHGSVEVSDVRGSVHAESVNQAIRISNVVGDVTAESVNGAVLLTGINAGAVDASSVNGRIEFTGSIADRGSYTFDTHQGDVIVNVPAATNADVSVATHNGSIEADFPVQVRGDVTRRGELRFQIGRGGAVLRAESFNGAIRIRRADGRTR